MSDCIIVCVQIANHMLQVVIYAVHIDQTCSSLKMAKASYHNVSIVQLVSSEIRVYCSIKNAGILC